MATDKPTRICSVEDCERGSHVRGWCDPHYRRWMKFGDPLVGGPIRKVTRLYAGQVCSVGVCDNSAKGGALGYCNAHYLRVKLHGDPMPDNAVISRALDFPDGTRECKECGQRKPLSDYHRDKNASLGRRPTCKVCRVNVEKARYSERPEYYREKYRKDRAENRDRYRVLDKARYIRDKDKRVAAATMNTHIRRARIANAPVDKGLTVKSLRKLDGDDCCFCGVGMVFASFGAGERPDNQATIEHIQAISRGGGHTFSNTALSCWRCNSTKGASDGWEVREGHRLAS